MIAPESSDIVSATASFCQTFAISHSYYLSFFLSFAFGTYVYYFCFTPYNQAFISDGSMKALLRGPNFHNL